MLSMLQYDVHVHLIKPLMYNLFPKIIVMKFHYNKYSYFQGVFKKKNELTFDLCFRSHRNVTFSHVRFIDKLYIFTVYVFINIDCNVQEGIFPCSSIF